ncbi:hypothetical protein, partial [Paraburkholderia sp.]|uniref:hypothetical protein n=1 Tax=Paraburkholderia sp. TaxID=1926495 RepID=UPI002AFF621B
AAIEAGGFRLRNFGSCVAHATDGRDADRNCAVCVGENARNLSALRLKTGNRKEKWPAEAGHFASDASA